MAWPTIDETKPVGTDKVKTIDDAERETRTFTEAALAVISNYTDSGSQPALRTAVWTTATRPTGVNLVDRTTGFNTDLGYEEYYNLSTTTWCKKSLSSVDFSAINGSWLAATTYNVGDVCYPSGLSYLRMECVVAGTSGNTEPNWTGVGTLVTDNSVAWIVDDIRDGTPVGRPVQEFLSTPRAGYIKANGALLNRANYPRLWAYAQASGLVTDGAWSNGLQGCFSSGDGSTTFRVPDLRGEFVRGWDDARGIDGGRNFGSSQDDAFKAHYHISGVYDASYPFAVYGTESVASGQRRGNQTGCDTSPITSTVGGTETRPRNIALLYCIKY